MKLPYLLILAAGLYVSSCSSFRPPGAVRNPSRAGTAPPLADSRPTNPAPTASRKVEKRKKKPTRERSVTAAEAVAPTRVNLVAGAESLMGIPYKYGGNSPAEGFDCSGFVKYLYNKEGLTIRRVSRDQANEGTPIDPERARPGDLVFFRRGPSSPVFHVSMIVSATPGELWVIHPTSSRGVIRENILASNFWRPKIYSVRRLFD